MIHPCDSVQRFEHETCQCDDALRHTSLVVQQILAEKSIPVITQPMYSPDLTVSDFWLFPTVKMGHKRMHLAVMKEIKSNVRAELLKIPNQAFYWWFKQWQD
jgi:hypothetical protein